MSEQHHVIPIRVLAIVFGVLVALTMITVITAQVDLGALNMPLAIAIASAKALLVVSVFMALRWDNRVNSLIFSIGCVFVLVFLALTLSDTALRGILGVQPAGELAPAEPGAEAEVAAARPGEAAIAAASDESVPETAPAVAVVGGEETFTQFLCNTCHSLDGTVGAGPTLQGIGARQTREEIIASIQEPDAIVAEDWAPGVMAATLNALSFSSKVTEEEFESLIDFVERQ